ncbi:MFS transporter [Azohydromonas lata]|uniref:MFS transporter n=1 Tax=Azohydromonas lata TaxID=45677 RepID=A0ABU5IP10_9BURK|nr:MFS transporter [Azohydromonas lata]MDZ5460625.1 MFS transporter [Azohydromonas lata]
MPRSTRLPERPASPAAQALAVAAARQADEPPRRAVLALFSAVMLPMFLAAVDQTLLATATPRIAADFSDLGDTAWITIGYLIAATVTAPLYGRLGDRFGRRRMLLAALAVFALGSLACALARGMAALIAARLLQGLGGGGLMVLCQALIGELVPPRLRPRYQAYFAIVFTASSVGGPVIGGLVVHHADWRWLFLANVPLCALAAWRVLRLPPSGTAPALRGAPTDPLGLLLFVVTAVSALLWFSLAGHRFGWLSAASVGLVVLTLGAGTVLLRQQRRHASPFLPLELLRLPGVGWICGTVLVFAASMFALVFLLPIQLQLGHGANAADAGLQMLPLTLGLVVGSTLNGRITARTGLPTRMPPRGLSLSALALGVLALAPSSPALLAGAAAVVGLGFGTVMASAQLATQTLAGRERLGAAAGLLSLTRSLGASLGTAIFGGLAFVLLHVRPGGEGAAQALPTDLSPQALTQAFHVVYGVLAVFVAAGAWIASRVPKVHLEAGVKAEPAGE